MTPARKVMFLLMGLVLMTAATITILPAMLLPPSPSHSPPLRETLGGDLAGWTAAILPLAQTPELARNVGRILQFDDAICVRFSRPGAPNVTIYAAYWRPGRAGYGLVGAHTPDTCWVSDGWTIVRRDHAVRRKCGVRELKAAEEGVYAFKGEVMHVMFWHLVGGEPHAGYGLVGWVDGVAGYIQRLPLIFRDLRRYSLNLAQEQMFVRISADMPIAEMLKRDDVQELLWALEPLGVWSLTTASDGDRTAARAGS